MSSVSVDPISPSPGVLAYHVNNFLLARVKRWQCWVPQIFSLSENQINYVATSRCLYKEGILTRDQLTQRMERDASNDSNGFMEPIVKSSLQGLTQLQNQEVVQAIEETDCKNRVVAWAAVELPEDKAVEFLMMYVANKESS